MKLNIRFTFVCFCSFHQNYLQRLKVQKWRPSGSFSSKYKNQIEIRTLSLLLDGKKFDGFGSALVELNISNITFMLAEVGDDVWYVRSSLQ